MHNFKTQTSCNFGPVEGPWTVMRYHYESFFTTTLYTSSCSESVTFIQICGPGSDKRDHKVKIKVFRPKERTGFDLY